jgi:hypothetical protein
VMSKTCTRISGFILVNDDIVPRKLRTLENRIRGKGAGAKIPPRLVLSCLVSYST